MRHGIIRFVLALFVALSHLGISFYGYNIGVFAVVIFYLLAGFTTAKLYHEIFNYDYKEYIKDRFLRIYPLYTVVLVFSILIYLSLHPKSNFLSKDPDILDWLYNITIVPLNYYMFNGIDKFTLIPPAWSLGAEIQFYILSLLSIRYSSLFIAMSFMVFFIASIGIIDTDIYGYRLLIGVLFIFLLGVKIYNYIKFKNKKERNFIISLNSTLVVILIYILFTNKIYRFNIEVLGALIVGIPLLMFYRNDKFVQIDRLFGNLSYGLFLFHFPLIWLCENLHFHNKYFFILSVLFLSIFLSFLSHHFIERSLWKKYRYKKIRSRNDTKV